MNRSKVQFVNLDPQYRHISRGINKAIQKVLKSSSFIKGTFLDAFENDFARYIGTKHCIGVGSGTDALHLSLRAIGIGEGDEVIIPVNTFIATAYAVLYIGAKPVLVDIDPNTYNIDVDKIKMKITQKTKAIVPVHLYGQPANMQAINRLAKKYKLKVIEDACQSHGAIYHGIKTGNLGDVAAFSFYPSKNLGAFGDGGAITTNSQHLAKTLKKLREYGSLRKYSYEQLGFNSRLDSIQAAILSEKLKHLDEWNLKRNQVAKYYTKRLQEEIPSVIAPKIGHDLTSAFHLYVIRVKKREHLTEYLHKRGIQTGIHYPIPLHLQRSLKSLGYKKGDFPIAESISSEILSLPFYPELDTKQQEYVIASIKNFYQN